MRVSHTRVHLPWWCLCYCSFVRLDIVRVISMVSARLVAHGRIERIYGQPIDIHKTPGIVRATVHKYSRS